MTMLINSETVDRPGLYHMSEVAYHADPCPDPSLSRSIALKLIEESPLHAFAAHPRLTKQKAKEEKNDRAREIGSAAHAMLLNQPTEIAVLPYDDYKKKAAQQERAEAQERGAIPVPQTDYETVVAMVEKARRVLGENEHEAVRSLASVEPIHQPFNEVTACVKDPCGGWTRIRMDRIHVTKPRLTIIDYKTTEMSVSPEKVKTALYNNNYHFQDMFYRRVMRQIFPEIDRHEMALDFLFIMQEQQPPFEITVARVDKAAQTIGSKMVSAAFLLWRKCMAENDWPGYPTGIVTPEFPAYLDTRWCAREIDDPRLQGLGFDPMPAFENIPYKPIQIVEPV
ncbi:Phage exonuclease [Sinorhizobium sojae CCBAU 05684]|uniref:Phage exonuclease n=1 Tax=Sinorhizobium sojae CCBAU 05684 TaxID=716928 RepID=A0A249PES4_9HYPH|nr:PD-(D/E)XK nuclease-like domain-containing protein [Sinorhizobium sojae]ASY64450.1 Phage exonuclease [Sinorhizobium sojae CCBAU 05684]